MNARLPTQLTTYTGAPLPLPAMPQDRLLTVNIEQIPLFKEILGVPGIHIKPLRLDAERGEWVFMAVCAPGCALPLHYPTERVNADDRRHSLIIGSTSRRRPT